jgi:hypothetical protein
VEKRPPIRERLKEIIQKAYSGGYEFVIADSLTDIAGHFENEYARKSGQVAQGDWYKIIEGMKTFVHDLKNGDFHLIVTCIAAPPKEGSLIEIAPSLPGQLREQMLPMFQSIVLVTYDKKQKRHKLVVNDPARGLCDRFHSFGEDTYDVDITKNPLKAVRTMINAAEGVEVEHDLPVSSGPVQRTARPVARPARPAARRKPVSGGGRRTVATR